MTVYKSNEGYHDLKNMFEFDSKSGPISVGESILLFFIQRKSVFRAAI